MIITTSIIVTQCKKLGALSSNQAGLTNDDFLTYANLAMDELLADIMAVREDYILFVDAIPVTAGNDTYRIPYRAIASTARHVWFVDSGGSRRKLGAKYPENIEDYAVAAQSDTPDGVFVMGNSLVLLPVPDLPGTLEVMYPFNPNQLVDSTTTTTITAVNTLTNTITLNSAPSALVTGAFDIIDHLSGNGIIYYDIQGTVTGSQIIFNQAVPRIAVGNYVALAGQAPVPMIPEVAHPLLLEMTVLRIEILRGNANRIKVQQTKVDGMHKTLIALIGQSRIVSKAHPVGGGNPMLPMRNYT